MEGSVSASRVMKIISDIHDKKHCFRNLSKMHRNFLEESERLKLHESVVDIRSAVVSWGKYSNEESTTELLSSFELGE
jgi:hypothetical protein